MLVESRKENENHQTSNPQCSLIVEEVKIELSFLAEI